MTANEFERRIEREGHGGEGSPRVIVLGGGHVGHAVAESLASDGSVTLVDESDVVCRRATDAIASTVRGDPADAAVLDGADADDVDAAVVATPADAKTFLVTQLLRTRFGVETIVARADDPDLADVIGDQCDAVVTAPPLLAQGLESAVDRVAPRTLRW